MKFERTKKKSLKNTPCRTCASIRFFLLSVFGIILLSIIGTDSADILEGVSTMTVAIVFVGAIASLAIGKSLLEFAHLHRKKQS